MEYVIIAITVLFGAGLTFFSGFGLGTILLPVFSLFFDLPTAVGATAIVHLANNLFKFGLVSKHIHWNTLIRFGLPAIFLAFVGGLVLTTFDEIEILHSYRLNDKRFDITMVKIVIGSLMIFFAWLDLSPKFSKINFGRKYLPLGVSGHQGAFRAAFLSKIGLTKEQFIGTSNAVSLVVDLSRLSVYLFGFAAITGQENKFLLAISEGKMLLVIGVIFAFLGTYFGKKLIHKTTVSGIQKIVGVLLFLMGSLMIAGIL